MLAELNTVAMVAEYAQKVPLPCILVCVYRACKPNRLWKQGLHHVATIFSKKVAQGRKGVGWGQNVAAVLASLWRQNPCRGLYLFPSEIVQKPTSLALSPLQTAEPPISVRVILLNLGSTLAKHSRAPRMCLRRGGLEEHRGSERGGHHEAAENQPLGLRATQNPTSDEARSWCFHEMFMCFRCGLRSMLEGSWYLLTNYNCTYNPNYSYIRAFQGLISRF